MTSYADLARQVAKHLGRDNAIKQRILQSAPHLYALDAEQLEQMSSGELARHELKGYGIKVSDASDPVEVRDAFHGGRMFERGRVLGGADARTGGMDAAGDTYIDRYLKE